MKQINCIAIDDEPIALLVIKQFCERKGNIELKTIYVKMATPKAQL